MKVHLLIGYLFLFVQLIAQDVEKNCVLTIEVISENTNNAIRRAKVDLKVVGWSKTGAKGQVYFDKLSQGRYWVEVKAKWHKPEYVQIAVFHNDSNFTRITLEEQPENIFSIYGRVVDWNLEESIIEADVYLNNYNDMPRSTTTDSLGNFVFINQPDQIKVGEPFAVTVRKSNYKERSYRGAYSTNPRILSEFRLKEKPGEIAPNFSYTDRLIDPMTVSSNIPLLSIGASPEILLIGGGKGGLQVQPTSSFSVRMNLIRERKLVEFAIGWHMPYKVNTFSSFKTLNELDSELKTTYTVRSLGTLSLRYYAKVWNKEYYPFVEALVSFDKQRPSSSSDSEGSHVRSYDSYIKIAPRISGGLSSQRGVFEIEPYFSATYFKMYSQDFTFNYFGWADSKTVKQHFIQLGLGVNVNLRLFKH